MFLRKDKTLVKPLHRSRRDKVWLYCVNALLLFHVNRVKVNDIKLSKLHREHNRILLARIRRILLQNCIDLLFDFLNLKHVRFHICIILFKLPNGCQKLLVGILKLLRPLCIVKVHKHIYCHKDKNPHKRDTQKSLLIKEVF